MRKKSKFLIILLTILLLLILYLLLTSEYAKDRIPAAPAKTVTSATLDNDYMAKTKILFGDYLKLIQTDNFTVNQVTNLKNSLLELKVPAKFKELHLTLVLALTKMENYLNSKDEQDNFTGRQMVNQLKIDYGWLIN